jgi:hypothetical protein
LAMKGDAGWVGFMASNVLDGDVPASVEIVK